VSHTDLDHDGRRELEQHALRNVSELAEKLGARDTLDRRKERWFLVGAGVAIVVVAAVLGMSAMRHSGADEEALRMNRCLVDARAKVAGEARAQVEREHPELTPAKREEWVGASSSRASLAQCTKAPPAQ
jgi:hypothetical protein